MIGPPPSAIGGWNPLGRRGAGDGQEAAAPGEDDRLRLDIGGTDLTALERLTAATAALAARTADRISRLVTRVPQGWPVGFERELYRRRLPDIGAGVATGRLSRLGVRFEDGLREEVLGRAPSEYGVASLFMAMDRGPLDTGLVQQAIGLMGGEAIERRTTATTLPFASGHYTRFVAPTLARPAFARLVSGVSEAGPPMRGLVRATGVYFAATLLHPFADGNGRAARALFQCVLKADLRMDAPLFPLGPLFERNKALLLDAKYGWQLDGDADPLVRLIVNGVDAYCDMLDDDLPRA